MDRQDVSDLPPSAARVRDAARRAGLAVTVRVMSEPTRSAEEAARACGCEPAQIVKSLVFVGRTSGKPYLLLVSGKNRVDEKAVAASIGEALRRPDADAVRAVTGYAIGGIPPLGHDTTLSTWLDQDLLAFPTVWAAAGTPFAVFEVDPRQLVAATSATVIAVG